MTAIADPRVDAVVVEVRQTRPGTEGESASSVWQS